MTVDLIDEPERARIRDDHHRTLFVEAGAGTGKTTELVARIVRIVSTGRAALDEIVAITFTEAAASELRERVRGALERAVADVTTGATARQRCAAALDVLDAAAMQTIHAFAQRVLQAHASAAGLPPVFEVRDQLSSSIVFGQRWSDFLHRTLNADEVPDDVADLLRTMTALGVTSAHLRTVATRLDEQWHRLPRPDGIPVRPVVALDLSLLLEPLGRSRELLGACIDPEDRMATALRDKVLPWEQRLREAVEAGDELGLLRAMVDGPKLPGSRGRKANWPDGALDDVRHLMGLATDVREDLLEPWRQWVLAGIVALVSEFVLDGAERRRQAGTLEFHDLLVLASRVVQRPEVRRLLRSTYRFVLVDEFQDTDPLQVEIVDALTSGDDGEPAEGARFTVGDPKQSIYRFRQADISQYFAVRGRPHGEVIQLTTNFRTLPIIVSWVNATFEPLLEGSLREAWVALEAGRRPASDACTGSVAVVGDLEDGRSAAVRNLEAEVIVEQIVQARAARVVVHGIAGEVRPVRYGDMAVLMPSRRGLGALERSFRRAGVPYRVESRSLLWATQEIRDLLNVLRAIDDPTDAVAVVAALRSVVFGCSDDELVAWRAAGGGWDHSCAERVLEGAVADAMEVLGGWHGQRWWAPVPELIETVLRDRHVRALAFGRPRQREWWSRVAFLVDQARAWTEAGGSGLGAFVRWASVQQDRGADALESVVPDADDDAVRVMTVHASKGLEFPWVALMGLGAVRNQTDSARVLWDESGNLQLRIGSKQRRLETPGFPEAASNEERRDADEQARLLYVGVTRAKDHLVVGVHRTKLAKRSLAARLAEVHEPSDHRSRGATAPAAEPLVEGATVDGVLDEAGSSEHERWQEHSRRWSVREAVVAWASRPSSMSATAIAARASDAEGVLPVRTARTDSAGPDDLATRLAFGSGVHAVLEAALPTWGSDEVARRCADMARRWEVPAEAARMAHSVRIALASELVQEAWAARHWREVTASTTVEGVVVGGTIDLLFERDGLLYVVDYKTEAVPDEATTQHALARYRWQLATYVVAVERATGREVGGAALLFVPHTSDRARPVWLDDLGAARAGLPELLRGWVGVSPGRTIATCGPSSPR